MLRDRQKVCVCVTKHECGGPHLKVLGETMLVVGVQLRDVFEELLDGDGLHIICIKQTNTKHSKGQRSHSRTVGEKCNMGNGVCVAV